MRNGLRETLMYLFTKFSLAGLAVALLASLTLTLFGLELQVKTSVSGNNAPSAESLAKSLDQALAQGQVQKARDTLSQMLQKPQIGSQMLMQAGIGLAQRELYPEAVQAFSRCAKDYPTFFEAHYNLGLANLALQKYPEALAALQHAPQGSKTQGLARSYLNGKILAAMGKPSEAESALSAAFAGAPQQENYALDLGLLCLRQRAYPRAVQVFEQGSRIHPRSTFLLLGLCLAQFLRGRATEAIETGRKLLELDSRFSPARLLLAFTLYQQGEFEEAERVAAAGLSVPLVHPYLYYLHAAVLLKLQSTEYDRIRQELAVASRGIPNCTLCYFAQSKVHQALGNFQAAIDDLEKAVKLDPEFSEAWYHLSLVYGRAGRREDATHAGAQFSRLKAEKANRETEILRNLFLETLGGQE